MTAVNHAVTGALIAVAVREPVLAVPLAFLSHFVLDALPHFGIKKSAQERNKKKLFWGVQAVDLILLTMFFTWLVFFLHLANLLLILICSFAAMSPDLIWVYRFFREIKTKIETEGNMFVRFHRRIQRFERPWAIVLEAFFLLAVFSIFLNLA